MSAIRFSLITERETLDLPREAGTLLLGLLTAAWLHLVFFTAWEALAGPGPGFFRLELPAPPAPLEIVLTLEEEKPEEPSMTEPSVMEPSVTEPSVTELSAESPAAPAEAESQTLAAEAADLEITQTLLGPEAEEGPNPSPPVTVEAEAPRFISYSVVVRRAINDKYITPPDAQIKFHSGRLRLVVNFTVGRDGSLYRFVVEESTGSAILDHAGLEALRAAAPFPAFPPELAVFSQLDLTMIFNFQPRYMGRAAPPGK
jgi:protein TonB